MADNKEKDRDSLLQKCMAYRRAQVEIPISRVISVIFRDGGTQLKALVASSEFTEQEEGNLVYVTGGSQHGILSLLDIPKEAGKPFTFWRMQGVEGSYDRDE